MARGSKKHRRGSGKREQTGGGRRAGRGGSKGGLILHGRHAVEAALNNPERQCIRLLASADMTDQARTMARAMTKSAADRSDLTVQTVDALVLSEFAGQGTPHQGLVLEVLPLPGQHLDEAAAIREGERNLVLVLDQVTDPQNVGAVMRSGAAFGARALITQDRHAPPETGALAKAASGALDVLPWVRVTNLARALDELAEMGYWRLGLDGEAEASLADIDLGANIAVVLGAEGKGMRHGTGEHIDAVARIPISGNIESLNVSNAAAVTLYELGKSS